MLANLGGVDLPIFLLIAFIVLVGGSQLPKIARNVGSAGKEFRKAQREAEDEEAAKKAEPPVLPPAAVTAGPVIPSAPPVTVASAPVVDDDKVTLSKADLAALLDERLGKPAAGPNN